MIRRFFRWLFLPQEVVLMCNDLALIRRELLAIRLVLQTEIERQQPKRNNPVGPIGPVKNK